MSRVKAVEQSDLSPENQEFYNMVPTLLGRVPNFHKTLSNSPYLAMAFLPINALAQREWEGTDISGKLKELIVIKTSHTNGCKYCYAHNTALGKAAGIEEEHIQALSLNDFSDPNLFSNEEILAIKWAEAVTNNKAAANNELFRELTEAFTEKQIVEMTILAAMFNMINRINDSLDVDLEEQTEVNKIKKSLKLNKSSYGEYLEWFSSFWNKQFPR
ncbi:MAG: carboxymuconolactone decarboxylase family protein [Hyphomicrobiales bacterium]|nr:carboxymuconolactone decarboxylase family protein [Hyphomicrobiales bacterium]